MITGLKNLYNGAENNLEASATSSRTFTPMSKGIIIFRVLDFYLRVLDFYFLVQFVAYYFNAIAQQKNFNCKDNFNDEKFSSFSAVKMPVFGN